ncbi:hypothetical protein [Pseudarthrobacter sp. MM222]|uniref:hypothetical protein n=1 Tax=Pseudarthrobacter sp. MM222 TaxID=3018929 RepID=UPI00221E9571|nr:hypothetical protein [Pseudarthrobacter sp. MM222]CAI3803799.1 hypothetical protein NKCBBBOE_03439 [Pseudarthrobacter sp. MM222]
MTLAAGRVRQGPVLHPRLCAVLTAASCLTHLWLAVENHHGAWLNAVMLALAAVCVPCTVHIWRHSRITALRQVMASALLMVAVHGFLLLGSGASGHGHQAGVAGTGDPSATTDLLAVVALEITTALLAATLVARLRVNQQRLPST